MHYRLHIGTPGEDRSGILAEAAQRHAGGRLRAIIAWITELGAARLVAALGGLIPSVDLVTSGNGRITEVRGLLALRQHLAAGIRVVYRNEAEVFHPKVYLFEGGAADPDSATILTGSMNLTNPGFVNNTEALSEIYVTGAERALLAPALAGFEREWESLHRAENAYVHDAVEDEDLERLFKNGLIVSPAQARQRRRQEQASRANARGPKTVPVAARVAVPDVDLLPITLPFPLDDENEARDEAARENKPARAGLTLTGHEHPHDLVFVRTLTPNDVGKLHGNPGTLEPDIGEGPRNEHPIFWGWPGEYATVVRNRARDEWNTRTLLITSRTGPAGVPMEMVLWHRKARRRHAAEHRFRPSRTEIRRYAPPNFDENGLVVFERSDSPEYDFVVRLISVGEPDYEKYDKVAAHPNPRHRYGYALKSAL